MNKTLNIILIVLLITFLVCAVVSKQVSQPNAYMRGVKDALHNKVNYSYVYNIVGNDTLDVDTLVNLPDSY